MIQVTISPSYEDLFEGPVPTIEKLLIGIPSKIVLGVLAMLNAELFQGHQGIPLQMRLFDLLMQRQTEEFRQSILNRARAKIFLNNGEEIAFFSIRYNMEFIHYELINYRSIEEDDLSPEQEINFLKAYYLIVRGVSNFYTLNLKVQQVYNPLFFYQMVWPSFLEQFEIGIKVNPFEAMIKGFALLSYLKNHSEFEPYNQAFLVANGCRRIREYMGKLIEMAKAGYKKDNASGQEIASFVLFEQAEIRALLEHFSVDISAYKHTFKDDSKNFSGLRARPLLKVNGSAFIVLNWNFLSNKLYDGLIFDFYEHSGINEKAGYKSLPDFKRFISIMVTEKFLFEKLLTDIFQDQAEVLQFDNNQIPGHPDCYLRNGNEIALFEIKDAYFPAGAVTSGNLAEITEAIDIKYNTENKGTGQIIKQLKFMTSGSFESSGNTAAVHELTIYPVIVYTDQNFALPGINNYLKGAMKKKLDESGLERKFKSMIPVTFISLHFFMKLTAAKDRIKRPFMELISAYHSYIETVQKKLENETRDEADFYEQSLSFETFVKALCKDAFSIKMEDYLAKLVQVLDFPGDT
jgi:hypothetical protein